MFLYSSKLLHGVQATTSELRTFSWSGVKFGVILHERRIRGAEGGVVLVRIKKRSGIFYLGNVNMNEYGCL